MIDACIVGPRVGRSGAVSDSEDESRMTRDEIVTIWDDVSRKLMKGLHNDDHE